MRLLESAQPVQPARDAVQRPPESSTNSRCGNRESASWFATMTSQRFRAPPAPKAETEPGPCYPRAPRLSRPLPDRPRPSDPWPSPGASAFPPPATPTHSSKARPRPWQNCRIADACQPRSSFRPGNEARQYTTTFRNPASKPRRSTPHTLESSKYRNPTAGDGPRSRLSTSHRRPTFASGQSAQRTRQCDTCPLITINYRNA